MKLKYLVVLAAVGLLSSCTKDPDFSDTSANGGNPEATAPDGNDVISGWVRIKLSEQAAPLRVGAFTRGAVESGDPRLDAIAAELGATEIRRVFSEGGKFAERRRKYGMHLWYDIKIDETIPVSRASSSMAALPGVEIVEPIYKAKMESGRIIPLAMMNNLYTPSQNRAASATEMPFNDPELSKQWHYNNDGSLKLATAGADINLFEGWKLTAGIPEVIVAIIDTGVQFDHPDLAANMWINEAEATGIPGEDDDNNGYIDDIYGWNFSLGHEGGTIIPVDHGTHVAGTVAAVNNNGIGVCGVAGGSGNNDGVRIMSVSMFSGGASMATPSGDMFAYAADNGAVITQNSWDVGENETESLRVGIKYFNDNAGTDKDGNQIGPVKGGLCIFAAGNSNANKLAYPPRSEDVLCVSAMSPIYKRASYSNYATGVDIMGPGGEMNMGAAYGILSTLPRGQYGYFEGTSMATPHVTGVAALIASYYAGPGFTREQFRTKLLTSFKPLGSTESPQYVNLLGVGVVDAAAYTVEDPGTAPQNLGSANIVGIPDKLKVTGIVPADGNGMPVAKYILKYRIGTGAWTTLSLVNNKKVGEAYEYIFELVQLTEYNLELTAADRFGNLSNTLSFTATTQKHTNNLPKQKSKFLDVEIPEAKPGVTRKYRLNYYFTDPDIAYGDVLRYEAVSSDERVATLELNDVDNLVLTPVAKGKCVITVKAIDKEGAYIEATFNVDVKKGEIIDPIEPPVDKEEIPAGEIRLSNPVAEMLTIQIGGATPGSANMKVYDSGARLMLSSSVPFAKKPETTSIITTTNVSALGSGTYTAIVELNGTRYKSTFIKR